MTHGSRRGVTRGYVGGLIVAAVIIALSLLIAVWGLLSLWLDTSPVSSGGLVSWAAPFVVLCALAVLAVALWQQALVSLRGRKTPSWGLLVSVSVGTYLIWGIIGSISGMSIGETWLSPFAAALVPIWGIAYLLFWGILSRRLFTDRPTPKWPWESGEEDE